MTTMNVEIYDALIQAKFPEKPARVVAQAITATSLLDYNRQYAGSYAFHW